jgi:hypothetical protein
LKQKNKISHFFPMLFIYFLLTEGGKIHFTVEKIVSEIKINAHTLCKHEIDKKKIVHKYGKIQASLNKTQIIM